MTLPSPNFLIPDWPVSGRVKALITTRQGGVSAGAYGLAGHQPGGFNLGDHVGDDAEAVAHNRALLPAPSPVWLRQVHGATVVNLDQRLPERLPEADAAIATQPARSCVVLTADCLSVLFADRLGRCVGSAPAGWRGLSLGVLEQTVLALRAVVPDAELCAYLGPAIGPGSYEVGSEVAQVFLRQDAEAERALHPASQPGKFMLDLYTLARQRLARVGVTDLYGGDYDTLAEPEVFYSFRRDGVSGRMASVVWLDET
ncbi:MAG: peptidoglycan editing factor PgeF [Burkholderiales bacterium]